MPLCGTKKVRKQKRDLSPLYREDEFDKTLKEAKDALYAAEKKYEDAKRRAEKAQKENERLRREVQDLKEAAKAKAKDAADGAGMSMLAQVDSAECTKFEERDFEVTRQLEAAQLEAEKAKTEVDEKLQLVLSQRA